jgi:hypothetical protein
MLIAHVFMGEPDNYGLLTYLIIGLTVIGPPVGLVVYIIRKLLQHKREMAESRSSEPTR